MKYADQYHLTSDQNRRYAKMDLVRLVFTNSRFEGLTTTLPQTQTIIDGMGVQGVSTDDIETILQLKRGWQYVIRTTSSLDLAMEKKINKPITLHNETYTPKIPNEKAEEVYLTQLLSDTDKFTTDKAMTLMYHNMRSQIFWDGNKRSATQAANKIMIDGGAGLINVPLDRWDVWNKLISAYYQSGDMEELKNWTYHNGIQGVDI